MDSKISIDLGKNRHRQRQVALRHLANICGYYHAGTPSVGKYVAALADERNRLRKRLPIVEIVDVRVVECNDLRCSGPNGTIIKSGYQTIVVLELDGKQVEVEAINALVYGVQDAKKICESKKNKLLQIKSGTPGEIRQACPGLSSRNALIELGIPVPPMQRSATNEEMVEFRRRTGKAYIYLQNEIYAEWAKEYNRWIIDNLDLAADYGCRLQNENYRPVTEYESGS